SPRVIGELAHPRLQHRAPDRVEEVQLGRKVDVQVGHRGTRVGGDLLHATLDVPVLLEEPRSAFENGIAPLVLLHLGHGVCPCRRLRSCAKMSSVTSPAALASEMWSKLHDRIREWLSRAAVRATDK